MGKRKSEWEGDDHESNVSNAIVGKMSLSIVAGNSAVEHTEAVIGGAR